jgi:hypothetical protein
LVCRAYATFPPSSVTFGKSSFTGVAVSAISRSLERSMIHRSVFPVRFELKTNVLPSAERLGWRSSAEVVSCFKSPVISARLGSTGKLQT